MKREPITKKMRFEVFKRDSFTCQYCGRKAPDVSLEIDHIKPVAKGGSSDILNLVTSCKGCNAGKSDRELSDNSVIEKQHKQLSELQERKEQLEMMVEWQKELTKLNDFAIEKLSIFWAELIPPYRLNDNGKRSLEKLLNNYSPEQVMEAMRITVKQYIEFEDDRPTHSSVQNAWEKVGGICEMRKLDAENPVNKELYYIRGILRNRLAYLNEGLAIGLLRKCVRLGAPIEVLKEYALEVKTWAEWHENTEEYIEYLKNQNG
ncbi:MAG: HNH endonuclease [Bacteroidales bacterium]|nr:HNH endonuclease [Bacteroidales bacterium]